jgi:hypothetical protein
MSDNTLLLEYQPQLRRMSDNTLLLDLDVFYPVYLRRRSLRRRRRRRSLRRCVVTLSVTKTC